MAPSRPLMTRISAAFPGCTDNTTKFYSDQNVANRAADGQRPKTATDTAVGPGLGARHLLAIHDVEYSVGVLAMTPTKLGPRRSLVQGTPKPDAIPCPHTCAENTTFDSLRTRYLLGFRHRTSVTRRSERSCNAAMCKHSRRRYQPE
ncbi:hypothetical protein CBM2598_U10231 [Cupriavidus taiwanensis]|uniref:Uncharacterized protein n=1 Tax=Cupriavidus taiwanensis TaxID=164546 RepID=A0A7Z7JHE9_9BURK|nr:hypothetical protein CBM2597_U10122 [Cupriavidus taiwanensis]SOZ96430.1 hypothetical protein CBM2598_U10231 [Cupriavidus taiwanensis]SPC25628.1 hypothetical protein CBM2594_U10129 [Cupriavidus taiwanensis]